MSHWLFAIAIFVPLAATALSSPELRRWLRGTGSIRQTASNLGVGALFFATQISLRGTLLAAFALFASLVPWKLPEHAVWSYAVTFVLLDLIYYWEHRLEHAVPLLWAIHVVHHQSRDFNLSVSFRAGVLTSVSLLCFHAWLALAGVTAREYAVVVTVHGLLLFTLHARTKRTLGPGRFFNAPVFHRVHHGAATAYIDKNFGGVFLAFDRVFGTFAPYTEEPAFGVVGEDSPSGPLSANLAPFSSLWRHVGAMPTFSQKFRALFVR